MNAVLGKIREMVFWVGVIICLVGFAVPFLTVLALAFALGGTIGMVPSMFVADTYGTEWGDIVVVGFGTFFSLIGIIPALYAGGFVALILVMLGGFIGLVPEKMGEASGFVGSVFRRILPKR